MPARAIVEEVKPPVRTKAWDFRAHIDGDDEAGPHGWGATAVDALDDLKDNLDAWECCGCGSYGKREVYREVTHLLGTDNLPFMETCDVCGGVGHCGPDAEKRAAVIKAKATGSAS